MNDIYRLTVKTVIYKNICDLSSNRNTWLLHYNNCGLLPMLRIEGNAK